MEQKVKKKELNSYGGAGSKSIPDICQSVGRCLCAYFWVFVDKDLDVF